jgi:glycosyltransferase involved in cell wall biosynthesis
MRIGLLTTSYPRTPGDYAGSFVEDRVRELLGRGHLVDVLAAGSAPSGGDDRHGDPHRVPKPPRDGSHRGKPGGIPRDRLNLTVTRLPSAPAGHPPLFYGAGAPEMLERGGVVTALAALRFSAALAAAAADHARSWDAIESHWLLPSALVALAVAPRLPRRAYAHSGDVALLERLPAGRALARQLARGGTELRFVSECLRARFAALAGATVGTVELLAAPPALFVRRPSAPDAALRRRLGLRGPTVVAVGRLVPIKGHDVLLRSCARARAAGSNAEVVILGDGPERPRLTKLGRDLGVPLRLPGFVARAEVARWLQAADLYVQSSIALPTGRTEGAPLATVEAQTVGIPVVIDCDPQRLANAIAAATGAGAASMSPGRRSVTGV